MNVLERSWRERYSMGEGGGGGGGGGVLKVCEMQNGEQLDVVLIFQKRH